MIKKIVTVGVAAALVLGLAACSESKPTAQSKGQAVTEQAFDQQSTSVPYPVSELKDSLERRNLRDRLLRTNKPDAIGYVYLMNFGQIVGYYTVKGKVSSTQSQMTTDQLIVPKCDNGGCSHSVVNAPGDDGSYGANEPGIFFFTTEGAMVTTSLDYIWADNQIAIDTPRLG
jgi:hypothetical protein